GTRFGFAAPTGWRHRRHHHAEHFGVRVRYPPFGDLRGLSYSCNANVAALWAKLIVLVSMNSRSPSIPYFRPSPLAFTPPNGCSELSRKPLTEIVPVCTARATSRARSSSAL